MAVIIAAVNMTKSCLKQQQQQQRVKLVGCTFYRKKFRNLDTLHTQLHSYINKEKYKIWSEKKPQQLKNFTKSSWIELTWVCKRLHIWVVLLNLVAWPSVSCFVLQVSWTSLLCGWMRWTTMTWGPTATKASPPSPCDPAIRWALTLTSMGWEHRNTRVHTSNLTITQL